ncbi:glutathione S-transferase family protein [Vibrio agarivorans]|uniref:Glutathione S-transferase family protein n=1 Tax=Vibrio agarivorans TaxID=153622 RepID=A0ABT7Y6K4_9VIBR|nr:glutathione S-transferase family protein [Vibrio agarivorans]MDN2483632.1 glutathione S-transferase family protein [Vibrio agarivorans]
MIKIVSFTICPFVQRVTAALEARNLPYEIEYISLKEKPQWFLDISPNGQVPVMVTESGVSLFESDAIVEFIEDEYGPLEQGVSNEQKALDRAWSYLGSKNYLPQCGMMSSKDEQTLLERESKLRQALGKVEKQLSGESLFFISDSLSNVDIAWLPVLHRAAIIEQATCHDLLRDLPKVKAWQKALLNTGLAEKSVSEDFVEKFKAFYLQGTFLGEGKAVVTSTCQSSGCCG